MRRRYFPLLLLVSVFLVGCGDDDEPTPTTPTTTTPPPAPAPTPTPTPPPPPPPPPPPTSAPLAGTVSNTNGQRLSGAIVSVIDGPDLGRDAVTDSNGAFRFSSLTYGNANFAAR